jgi:patatin-like phospholipase/acyl hydrolase
MREQSNFGKWELWGPLRDRYESRAEAGGPYRLLALDGGGIRGLITLEVLVRLEELLAQALDDESFRLSKFFDYIGGTSTGAIIATGLARGMSATELLGFYKEFGNEVFRKRNLFERWKSLYGNGPLETKLQEFFKAPESLKPEYLKTLLLVVTRNATTDSAWPISSNPWAKYNAVDRKDCNLCVPQWKIVRASTAAPVYFPPEVIEWSDGDPSESFVFVDGGTTAYNNPAFLMARMATEPAYRLRWPRGEDKMLVVSIGTGSGPTLGMQAGDAETNVLASAMNTLSAVMNQAQFDQDVNCRTVGRCTFGPKLDDEIGDLVPRDDDGNGIPLETDLGRAFLYARYDAELTTAGLQALDLGDLDPAAVSKLDSVANVDDLSKIGKAVAAQVDLRHFGRFVKG